MKYTRTHLFVAFLIFVSTNYFSQNVGIGNNNPQSKLHVSGAIRSDTLVGTGVRNLFTTPNGRIYDSLVAPLPADWLINGNSNIGAANFLGTLNANDLIFKTNNNEVARFIANGNLGIGTANPSLSSLVEIASTTSGLLIPRMTTAQRIAIVSPSNGLMVYDLTINCVFFYNMTLTAWQSLCAPPLPTGTNDVSGTYPALTVVGLQTTPVSSVAPTNGQILQYNGTAWVPTNGNYWDVLGNAGTNAAVNFLGTTDAQDLVFKTNNIEYIRTLANNGNVGIFTTTPSERLHINGNVQLGNALGINVLGDKFYMSNTFNNTDDFWMARFNSAADNSEWRFNISDPGVIDRITFGTSSFPAGVWQPLVDIINDGRMGVGTTNPRGKFDVLNGDAYVADNVYPQNSFNIGRSFNSIYTDNIRPFTDNGFRVYDGNSNSHLRLEAVGQCQIQAYTTAGATPNLLETPGTEGILSLNPTGGGVRVGLPNGLSTTINPALPDNPLHRLTVGSGYFVAGNYNSDPAGGQAPGTTWINGVGGLAVGMNRNAGRSHVDLWNTSDVSQAAANANVDRGFEFRGYDNLYAERTMARIDGIGQFFSNGTFAISDKRFKSNIVPFNEKVLSKLMQVKTYNYQMHQPVSKNGGALEKGSVVNEKDFGVIVQELYELFPGVVYKPKNESIEAWSVDYSRFGLYLLQGMKEQQEIINEQKTEIKQLNDKYTELLNRVSKLESK